MGLAGLSNELGQEAGFLFLLFFLITLGFRHLGPENTQVFHSPAMSQTVSKRDPVCP